MKKYCVHCLKPFETEHDAQEFCCVEHRNTFNVLLKKERKLKDKLMERPVERSDHDFIRRHNSDDYISPYDTD